MHVFFLQHVINITFQGTMDEEEHTNIQYMKAGRKRSQSEGNAYGGDIKRDKLQENTCLTCGKSHEKMTVLNDSKVWNSILGAAKVRGCSSILNLEYEEKFPQNKMYNSECRKRFCHKKTLEKISNVPQTKMEVVQLDGNSERKQALRQAASQRDKDICIFCNKENRYILGGYQKDKLTKAQDLRADTTLRKIATSKCDTNILRITSTDIVAQGAHYHRLCYRDYVRGSSINASKKCDNTSQDEYESISTQAHAEVFDYVQQMIFSQDNVTILALSDATQRLSSKMKEFGADCMHESTRVNFRRKLENKFGDSISFLKTDTGKVYIMDKNIQASKLALELLKCQSDHIRNTALHLRNEIQGIDVDKPWPPLPEELDENYIQIPPDLLYFLHVLLGGNNEDHITSERRELFSLSLAQDMIFTVTNGKTLPAKHILLAWAVKALTGNVELVKTLNRLGSCVSLSKLEEIITALVINKCGGEENENAVPLPQFAVPHVTTCLGFDNIDRNEETLDGGRTSHRVNGIIVQPSVPHVGPKKQRIEVPKNKRRSVPIMKNDLPQYVSPGRMSPPAISAIQPEGAQSAAHIAQQKDVIWTLVRQLDSQQQAVSSWTGFNIKIRDNVDIRKDNIGYLPTINAPATKLSTVQEILQHCHNIKDQLQLDSIVCVTDQAIYAKLVEIVSSNPTIYEPIVLRMGGFHTCNVLINIIGMLIFFSQLLFKTI